MRQFEVSVPEIEFSQTVEAVGPMEAAYAAIKANEFRWMGKLPEGADIHITEAAASGLHWKFPIQLIPMSPEIIRFVVRGSLTSWNYEEASAYSILHAAVEVAKRLDRVGLCLVAHERMLCYEYMVQVTRNDAGEWNARDTGARV